MNQPNSRRLSAGHRLLLAALCGPLWSAGLAAETSPAPAASPTPPTATPAEDASAEPVLRLEPVVTTATRTPATFAQLGSTVTVVSSAELERRQINSLAGALGLVPGAAIAQSGQRGAITSVFFRGAESDQTLFLVDGIRISDPNTEYFGFLGGSASCACDSLEVAHGPQSTLYGGEAIGGVIALRSGRGQGAPSGRAALELGSFGTIQGAVFAQGEDGPWAYSASLAGGHTDNDRPDNAFDSATLATRLDRAVNERVALGATLRGFEAEYESPGAARGFGSNDPNATEQEHNWLGTVFADLTPSEDWTARLTLGGQQRRLLARNPPNPPAVGATSKTEVTNRRVVLDGQATYSGLERHRVTGGFTVEANHTRNTGFGDIDEKQGLWALFIQDEWQPVEPLSFTAGLRHEHYDTFGEETTGRATAAWTVRPESIKLRASYGTGFRAPSFLDLYGQNPFYVGNPDLDPERSRGWDAGIDYTLPRGKGVLSATWFDNRLRDLITGDFAVFPSTVVNVERARTYGMEFGARLEPVAGTRLTLAYTWLEAENQSQGLRLLRRPRHTVNADAWHDFGGGVSAGAGAQWVIDREDIDAATFARVDQEDYLVTRLYVAWEIDARWTLKARVENALDERYEQVNGYPQPGRGVYGGAEWRW